MFPISAHDGVFPYINDGQNDGIVRLVLDMDWFIKYGETTIKLPELAG